MRLRLAARFCLGLFMLVSRTEAADAPERVEIRLLTAERVKGGFELRVEIGNHGRVPVFLETATRASRHPYTVSIEQIDPDGSWIFLGPHRDAPAVGVFELAPNQFVSEIVFVPDPVRLYRPGNRVRTISVQGRVRATVRYFHSQREWERFAFARSHFGERRPPTPSGAVSEAIPVPHQ